MPDLPSRPSDARRALATVQESLGTEYDIKRELGKGSMARVYLARERALGRLVAIKVLLPGLATVAPGTSSGMRTGARRSSPTSGLRRTSTRSRES